MKNTSVMIDDLPTGAVELSDDELSDVAGGLRIIIIVVRHACSSAVGGGYDYD